MGYALAKHLEKLIKTNGQGIIVVDSIYSVNGSICALEKVCNLAEKYKCVLVVDESHSLGIHGKEGSGLIYELGLNKRVHFITVSLAKSFAGRAGIIGCCKEFANYFPFVSFPAIFSSTLLTHEIAAFDKTLSFSEKIMMCIQFFGQLKFVLLTINCKNHDQTTKNQLFSGI